MSADYHLQSSSFAHKLKSSICCFHNSEQTPTTRSPCSWFKSTAILDCCRYLIARIARGRRRRRYPASPDFTYDSSSYALNFEDDSRDDDEFPFRDFSARLPPIKDRLPATKFPGSHGGITISACT